METPPEDLVTTVMITRNGGDTLVRTMERHGGETVIMVDNGSSDGSADIVAEQHPHVRVVRLSSNIGAVARNVGVALARTPYVAFSDDDSSWAPGALSRAAAILERYQDVAAVAAKILVGPENRPDPVCADMIHSPLPERPTIPGRSVVGFVACATVVRRVAFFGAGGFDPVVFFAGEEERLALDMLADGWELVHAPQVVAHHDPHPCRDRSQRVRLIVRNSILTAVMRRPWAVTLERTAAAVRSADGRAGLAAALPRVVKGLRYRRPVPLRVERWLAVVERSGQDTTSLVVSAPARWVGRRTPTPEGESAMTTDPQAALVHLSDTDLTPASEDDDIRGRTVVDRNGDDIGEVDDLIIDPDQRHVRFLQVGSGGFLGLGEQKILIPVDAIDSIDDAVHIEKERTHIAAAPRYDPKLIQEPKYYEDVYDYYGYPPYWTPGYAYRPFPFR